MSQRWHAPVDNGCIGVGKSANIAGFVTAAEATLALGLS
jgi:hypothetical protein